MSLQTGTAVNGGSMFAVAEETHQHPAESDIERIRAVENGIRQINNQSIGEHKSSSEAIADQTVALISRVDANINERFDGIQKSLNELRAEQSKRVKHAEEAIRAVMAWADYMAQSADQLSGSIDLARGDLAELTKA